MTAFDHLAIACSDLEEGAGWLKKRLGIAPDPGGRHPLMGTWNRLLSLGPGAYLELIAIDPEARAPDRPRWFGLDNFDGSPRIVGWVARGNASRPAPDGADWAAASRGDLRWSITLPRSGQMAGGGTDPALIDWQGGPHPTDLLPDRGLRLERLILTRPGGGRPAHAPHDPRIRSIDGAPSLSAVILTPAGKVPL